jgi:phospholipid/cholesterol/gamma-HCH transport system permease protein
MLPPRSPLTPPAVLSRLPPVVESAANPVPPAPARTLTPPDWTAALMRWLGAGLITVRGLGAFALITLVVLVRKWRTASRVVHPLIRREIARDGVRLLPLFLFLALALGLVVVGQTVSWLTRLGAIDYLGSVMAVVVFRELGPLTAALVVLARAGTANVVELGTARASGEVEALETLGIDPIHYLVVPRVVGMAASLFALTVYLLLGALVSGYVWAFLQDVALTPGEYFRQLAAALGWIDFLMLAFKTLGFGAIIAVITCYHGLAQPLRLREVSAATVRAVGQSVVACVLLDALFILSYLVPR